MMNLKPYLETNKQTKTLKRLKSKQMFCKIEIYVKKACVVFFFPGVHMLGKNVSKGRIFILETFNVHLQSTAGMSPETWK